jgi:hypothetical protein
MVHTRALLTGLSLTKLLSAANDGVSAGGGADRPSVLHGEGVDDGVVGVLGVVEGDFGVDLQAGAGGVAGVGSSR